MTKEYIEREAARRELLSWAVCMNRPEYLMKDDALHVIDSIPAADVVEVVRCEDCSYNPNLNTRTKGMVWCRKFRSELDPTDYCSYGERSKEND